MTVAGGDSNGHAVESAASLEDWIVARTSSAARGASATERVEDAVASLDYLLLHDLFIHYDQVRIRLPLLISFWRYFYG